MSTKNTLAYLPATSASLPASSSARLQRLTIGLSGDDRFAVSFSSSTSQQCVWTIPDFPASWQGSTLSLDVYCVTTATSGSVNLQASVEAITPGDSLDLITSSSFDTANAINNVTVPITAGSLFTATITLTNADSIAIADHARFKLVRDTSNGSAAADLLVLGCLLYENVSNLDLSDFGTVSFTSGNPLTFPSSQGTSGQVLTTDGSGTLSWNNPDGITPLSTKTTAYSMSSSDNLILADTTSASFAVTLPTATTTSAKTFTVKSISASNAVTVKTVSASGQTIDGNSSVSLSPFQSLTVVSNGSNFFIL